MNRKFQMGLLLFSAVASLAFIWVLRTLIEERRTIVELRQELERRTASVSEPAASESLPVLPRSNLTVQPPVVLAGPSSETNGNQSTQSAGAEIENLRTLNGSFAAELREKESTLRKARPVAHDPEDSGTAYFGPGIWISTNSSSKFITRIEISAGREGMRLKAWASCGPPKDCELDEVPFFVLDKLDSQQFQGGFAAWDGISFVRYMIVNFETSGLRVESIGISMKPERTNYRRFETMTRGIECNRGLILLLPG